MRILISNIFKSSFDEKKKKYIKIPLSKEERNEIEMELIEVLNKHKCFGRSERI